MSDFKATARQLKIKTGATQRITKDLKSYRKEYKDVVQKRDDMREGQTEHWYIKNAENMVEESLKMCRDCETRLENAMAELTTLIEGAKTQCEDGSAPEIEAAEAAVAEAKAAYEEK